MTLYYVTSNQGKIQSLQKAMGNELVLQVPHDIPEPRSPDVEVIAKEKVRWAKNKIFEQRKLQERAVEASNFEFDVVALDAGFYVPALNGFPKAYVNFMLETIDIEGLLKLLAGKDRYCEFRHCMACLGYTMHEPKTFIDIVPGSVATEQRGIMQAHHWSKLATVFVPQGLSKTLAEMSLDEYNAVRPQMRVMPSASEQFAKWYLGGGPDNPDWKYPYDPVDHPHRKGDGRKHPYKKY